MKAENYRPAHIEFDVAIDEPTVPEHLGTFNSALDAATFMQKNFFSTNQAITVNRHMDMVEKKDMREEYNNIMENLLPKYEQDMRSAIDAFNHAKVVKDNAIQMVDANINEAKAIAQEVKRGLVAMQLDEDFTWKLPYKGRFYFFTYIDKAIRLVKVADIADQERSEIFSQGMVNEEAFEQDKWKNEPTKKSTKK